MTGVFIPFSVLWIFLIHDNDQTLPYAGALMRHLTSTYLSVFLILEGDYRFGDHFSSGQGGQDIWDELLQLYKACFLKKLGQNTLKVCFSFQATLSIVYYRLKLGYHFEALAATLLTHSAGFPSYLHRENWNVMSRAGWLGRNCGYVLGSLSPYCLGESP